MKQAKMAEGLLRIGSVMSVISVFLTSQLTQLTQPRFCAESDDDMT